MRKTVSVFSLPRAAAISAMALLFAVSAQQAAAQDVTSSECQTAFDGAPANAYCSPTLGRTLVARRWVSPNLAMGQTSRRDRCTVLASCSITVRVGDTDRTFRNQYVGDLPFTLAETGTLDLCFSRDSEASNTHIYVNDGWKMVLSPDCGDGVDSATAKSDGLSLDDG